MTVASPEHDPKGGLLLIDTSVVGVTVGIMALPAGANAIHGNLCLKAHEGHYDNAGSIAMIASLADRGLRHAGLEPTDIRGIVLSTGPGSFTGIKIGLAFAHGWALGLPHPVKWLGLSALEQAAADHSRARHGQAATLFLPATRTHGFLAHAHKGAAAPARLIDVSTWQHDAKRFLTDPFDPGSGAVVTMVGTWPLLEKSFAAANVPYVTKSAQEVACDALRSMAQYAAEAWPTSFSSAIPGPNYLRLSTAEEQLAQRIALSSRHEERP